MPTAITTTLSVENKKLQLMREIAKFNPESKEDIHKLNLIYEIIYGVKP